MEEKDKEINSRLLDEFGLELGDRHRVYDYESGMVKTMKGKEIVAPGYSVIDNNRMHCIEFDPINNIHMMNLLFGSYMSELEESGTLDGDILSISTIAANKPGKIKAVVKINPYDGGPIKEVTSKAYNNETSCYADLVCRINGDDQVDMTEYDYDRRKVLKPMRMKQTKKKGNATNGKQ